MAKRQEPEHIKVWRDYEKGMSFNSMLRLNETVETNENFFIGKQWEGVEANGLPTPVFNFLKRVVLFTIASITANNLKMQASCMANQPDDTAARRMIGAVNNEFDSLFESNRIGMSHPGVYAQRRRGRRRLPIHLLGPGRLRRVTP